MSEMIKQSVVCEIENRRRQRARIYVKYLLDKLAEYSDTAIEHELRDEITHWTLELGEDVAGELYEATIHEPFIGCRHVIISPRGR